MVKLHRQKPSGNSTFDKALSYSRAGLSVIPVRTDGSKAPALPRADPVLNRKRCATEQELRHWFEQKRLGVGIQGGIASGNLFILDIEFLDFFDEWRALVEAVAPGLMARLPIVRTPGKSAEGGRHVYARSAGPVVATEKLAHLTRAEAERRLGDPGSMTAIEIKAEGGYVLTVGCPAACHKSGRFYEHVAGPSIEATPILTEAEVRLLLDCARAQERGDAACADKKSGPKQGPSPRVGGPGDRPGDEFNRRAEWPDVLPSGWKMVRQNGNVTYWRRPGKKEGISATIGHCRNDRVGSKLYVFSSNAQPFEAGKTYSKFEAFALLNHGGDFKAAAKALADLDYGTPKSPWQQTAAGESEHGQAGTTTKATATSNAAAGPAGPAGPKVWEELIPLSVATEVAPFPLSILPQCLQAAVQEIAIAHQCPEDYVAVPLLAAAAGAIGASRELEIKSGHVQPATVYVAVVAPPGSGKTPAQAKVFGPLYEIDESLHAEWERKREQYELEVEEYEVARRAKPKKDDVAADLPMKPTKPPHHRIIVSNTTVEGLVPILVENPRGVVLVSDELVGWVQAMNQYRDGGRGADVQFWLATWSCSPIVVDRKAAHEDGPLRVRKPFVCVIGGMTPDKLRVLRGDRPGQRAEQDGFPDRMLFSYPADPPTEPENWMNVSPQTMDVLRIALKNLRDLKMEPVLDGLVIKGYRPFLVRLTTCGRQAWQRFTVAHAAERNDDEFPAHLVGPWSKFRGYAARLALIIHYLRWACGEVESDKADVDGENMDRAAVLVSYFKSHARKVYAAMGADKKVRQARELLKWVRSQKDRITAKNPPSFSWRDLRHGLRKRLESGSLSEDDLAHALELLQQHGYLEEIAPQQAGRKATNARSVYFVNPHTWDQRDQQDQREPGEDDPDPC